MKILHTADLHLGASFGTRLNAREASLRREELLSSLLRLLRFAGEEGCAAVIIAGDLFDTEAAAAALAPTVFSLIGQHSDMDFYYLIGNHEGAAGLPQSLPKNLHIFGDKFDYFRKGNTVFFGKRDLHPSDFDNIHLQYSDFNILIAHGAWAEGYATSADLPLGLLASKGIDYLALGHYHAYEARRIDRRGTAVYCGCPEGRGFDETGRKGAVLIDTDGTPSHRFVPLAKRTLHRITADISDAKSLAEVLLICEAALQAAAPEDLVRLSTVGRRKWLPPVHPETLLHHFNGRFYHFEAEDGSEAAPCVEKLRKESSLRGAFIRLVEADASLSEDERNRILSLGLAAIGNTLGGEDTWS